MKKQWFTVQKVRPQLYALAEFNHFEKVVSYLVVGKTQAVLFDTGMGYKDIHKVIRTITKFPVAVFLTHKHWDHIGGVRKTDTVHTWSRDGQKMDIDGFTIQVIHTPGHTPDSVCYFLKDLNWLFVGDTLYPGPLYAHLPESDIAAYAQSLAKLCSFTNKKTLILPGHNAVYTGYTLLKNAATLMKQAIHAKKAGTKEIKGDGFSVLLR